MHVTETLELRAVCGLDALAYTIFLIAYCATVRWWHGGWMSWMVAVTHVATALITMLTAIFLRSIALSPPIAGALLPAVLLVLTPTVVVKLILVLRKGQRERAERIQAARVMRARVVPARAGPPPPAARFASGESGHGGPIR